ncbi:DUF6261 family protein [Saccharicrinis aurantiacus]|uniref:DUF6261 family protein n=1 Tax=Saccharicrinis aurantiacus TaxID=1849719 RepID=UPI00094F9D44|nr:DUF6261 family protein [Saccharicrinis aurantiacus]
MSTTEFTKIHRESVNYPALTNDSFYILISDSIKVAQQQNFAPEHVIPVALAPIIENMTTLNGVLSKEVNYSDRSELDAQRDDDYAYLKVMLQSNAINRDAAKKNAAITLLSVFDTFDINLDRLSLDAQTAQLDRVIAAWATPENKAHFETLELTADVNRLEGSAGAFKNYNIERTKNGNKQSPKVRDLRKAIQGDFVMWLNVLEGLSNLNKDEACYNTLKGINKYIIEQDALLKAKATRKAEEVSN